MRNLAKDVLIPILTLLVAFSGYMLGYSSARKTDEAAMKRALLQVTLPEKQKLYSSFMRYLTDSYHSAAMYNYAAMEESLFYLESQIFGMEPYLGLEKTEGILAKYQDYGNFCRRVFKERLRSDESKKRNIDELIERRDYFRRTFHTVLFDSDKSKM